MDTLEKEIINAFPSVAEEPIVSEEYIEENPDLMMIEGNVDYFKLVPSYMLWCLRYKDLELVDMHTVNALAEYGRTSLKENDYLNFKWRCNPLQRKVVVKFLNWCSAAIEISEKEQITRAIKAMGKIDYANQGLNPDHFFAAPFLFRFTLTKKVQRKKCPVKRSLW
ncbi:MAG: hypothetical protein OEZ58_06630 [Gammaproteobacteria bacterium]|nr:hypothetical protein [Gammaproteobacteria bacterium]